MVRGFATSVVSALTAFSLAAALIVSVFAQSHAATAGGQDVAVPCVEHHAVKTADLWSEACATICDTVDLHILLGASFERSSHPDQSAIMVTYDDGQANRVILARTSGIVLSHDPPGSDLYLTTQRLRI